MEDLVYDDELINELINKKIELVQRHDFGRFVKFKEKILEVGSSVIKKHGIGKNLEEIPYKELCYHGTFFSQLKAFDKITNDRFDSCLISNRKVKKINIYSNSIENDMIQDMVDMSIDYDINLLDKFLNYVLYILGDKLVKEIDFDDEDNEYFFKTFKPIPLLFFPDSYFMKLTTWDHLGLSFYDFINLRISDLQNILNTCNFKEINITYRKILLIESYFYAPYFVKIIHRYM